MGTPVIALFGGTDPRRHAPFRPPFRVLRAEAERGAPGNAADRLGRITPEKVYDTAIQLLSEVNGSSFERES